MSSVDGESLMREKREEKPPSDCVQCQKSFTSSTSQPISGGEKKLDFKHFFLVWTIRQSTLTGDLEAASESKLMSSWYTQLEFTLPVKHLTHQFLFPLPECNPVVTFCLHQIYDQDTQIKVAKERKSYTHKYVVLYMNRVAIPKYLNYKTCFE